MKNSRKAYEKHLNELYTDCYSSSEAVDNFCYLNNGKIKESTIVHHHANHTLGTLLRKHDPICFNTGCNEWQSGRK